MLTFGEVKPYQSEVAFESNLSDDKRALTFTFSDFVATVGGKKTPGSSTIRTFSVLLPLDGDDTTAEIEFISQGGVKTFEGATATIISSVNGRTVAQDFPAGSDESVQQRLSFAGAKPPECRLSIILLAGRDSKNENAEAFLNVLSIDVEILPRPK
jgi:hypothetical protein